MAQNENRYFPVAPTQLGKMKRDQILLRKDVTALQLAFLELQKEIGKNEDMEHLLKAYRDTKGFFHVISAISTFIRTVVPVAIAVSTLWYIITYGGPPQGPLK